MLALEDGEDSAFCVKHTTVLFGASGYLGRHVQLALRERGARVVCPSRQRQGTRQDPFHECDIRDEHQVGALLDEFAPEQILNCAALSSIAECRADPAAAREANRDFPEQLARWSARHDARLVHVSTDLVFPGQAPRGGYVEEAEPSPSSVYGTSKHEGEVAVLAADSKALVVRLPLLFGDSHGRGRGASDSVLDAVRRGECPQLFTDEWRTPLEVSDAARALVQLADGGAEGLLHVAGNERISRYQLGLLALAAHGLSSESVRASSQLGLPGEPRPPDVSLCAKRAQSWITTALRGPIEVFGAGDGPEAD